MTLRFDLLHLSLLRRLARHAYQTGWRLAAMTEPRTSGASRTTGADQSER